MAFTRDEAAQLLTLHGVQGPGDVYVFLQEGVAGAPNVLWDSDQAFPQDLWMDVNTHVHANWVFTEPGVYDYYCSIHGTTTAGMVGSVTVADG